MLGTKIIEHFIRPNRKPERGVVILKTSKCLGQQPRDIELLDESIVKLFKVAFDIDIKTCTEGEWAERISIKGGALKQWQTLINSERLQVVPSTSTCCYSI